MDIKKLFSNTKFLLLLILILAAGLRFWNITNIGINQWDEGEYLDAGESILEGKIEWLGVGLKPLHNASMALGLLIFGNYDYAGFAVVAMLGTLTVLIVYMLGKRFFNEKTGLLAAFILAITEYHIYFSRTLYSTVTDAFFFSVTILLYFMWIRNEKSRLYPVLLLIFIGFCLLIRLSAISVVFVILASEIIFALKDGVLKDRGLLKKRLIRFLFIVIMSGAMVLSLYGAYMMIAPENTFRAQFDSNMGALSGISFEYSTFYLENLVILGSPILLLALFLGAYKALESRKHGDIILFVWAFSILLVFSLYTIKRYRIFMVALPAICLLASRGIWMLKEKFGKGGKWLTIILILVLAATSLYTAYDTVTSSSTAYREAAEFVRSDGGQGVITSQLGIFQYYSNEKPLPVIFFDNLNSSKSELLMYYNQGYSHVIIDYRALRYNELAHEIVNSDSTKPAAKFDNRATLFDPTTQGLGGYEEFNKMKSDETYLYVYVYRLSDVISSF